MRFLYAVLFKFHVIALEREQTLKQTQKIFDFSFHFSLFATFQNIHVHAHARHVHTAHAAHFQIIRFHGYAVQNQRSRLLRIERKRDLFRKIVARARGDKPQMASRRIGKSVQDLVKRTVAADGNDLRFPRFGEHTGDIGRVAFSVRQMRLKFYAAGGKYFLGNFQIFQRALFSCRGVGNDMIRFHLS